MNATPNTRSPWRTRTTTSTGVRIRPPQINARATFIAGRWFPRTMVLLVRFGELALKSRFVRRQLRDRLGAEIQELFPAGGIGSPTPAPHRRIYGDVADGARGAPGRRRGGRTVSLSPAPGAPSAPRGLLPRA